MPDEQRRQIDAEVTMRLVVLVPPPGKQHQRRRHLDRGDRHQELHGAAREDSAGDWRHRRIQRPMSHRVAARK